MKMFKLIFKLVIKLIYLVFSIQSSYNNYMINLLKEKGSKGLFLKISMCIVYSLPMAFIYTLTMCFVRSIIHAFFVMGINWFDNWYVYCCLQFPSVKKYMLLYSCVLYNDPFLVLINPVEHKQLFFLFLIKIIASFSISLFLAIWFSISLNLIWKGILNLPSYGQILVMILVKFLNLLFENRLILNNNSNDNLLLFFIVTTCLCFALTILPILVLSIFLNNLSANPEDYDKFLKLAEYLNNKNDKC